MGIGWNRATFLVRKGGAREGQSGSLEPRVVDKGGRGSNRSNGKALSMRAAVWTGAMGAC